jgi:hypothetical protein
VDPEPARGERPGGCSRICWSGSGSTARFWELGRAQRGRLFLSRYSRLSGAIPELEINSFDIDKVLKERYRQEPLTLGAAWHYGFWRSYFSHAAITHPANDGLREEFSTAWDIVRKQPAVLFRTGEGLTQTPLRSVRIDLPMIVGPLPWSDGFRMERAWLEAISAAAHADLHTGSMVVSGGSFATSTVPAPPRRGLRLAPRHCARRPRRRQHARCARCCQGPVAERLETAARVRQVLALYPDLLLRCISGTARGSGRRWRGGPPDGVAMIHSTRAEKRSPDPRSTFLKARLIRARCSWSRRWRHRHPVFGRHRLSRLLGANGGAMTHLA